MGLEQVLVPWKVPSGEGTGEKEQTQQMEQSWGLQCSQMGLEQGLGPLKGPSAARSVEKVRSLLRVQLWVLPWTVRGLVLELVLVVIALLAVATVHAAVPPVLDGVVAAVLHHACDLGPLLANAGDLLLDEAALLLGDGAVVEVGLEVLVPALAALLGRARVHHLRNLHPAADALFLRHAQQQRVDADRALEEEKSPLGELCRLTD